MYRPKLEIRTERQKTVAMLLLIAMSSLVASCFVDITTGFDLWFCVFDLMFIPTTILVAYLSSRQ